MNDGGTYPVRTPEQIDAMRIAGRAVARAVGAGLAACVPGATTADVDRSVREVLDAHGVEGLLEGFRADGSPTYPAVSCVSVNEEVMHAPPGARALRDGDVVTVDVSARRFVGDTGWCADAASTTVVGATGSDAGRGPRREELERLVRTTRGILREAIASVRHGARWADIARAADDAATGAGFRLVGPWLGHGIGASLHEAPRLGRDGGPVLREGMTLSLEPMLATGAGEGPATRLLRDGWTVATEDRSVVAHEEHTVVVQRGGAAVLTAG